MSQPGLCCLCYPPPLPAPPPLLTSPTSVPLSQNGWQVLQNWRKGSKQVVRTPAERQMKWPLGLLVSLQASHCPYTQGSWVTVATQHSPGGASPASSTLPQGLMDNNNMASGCCPIPGHYTTLELNFLQTEVSRKSHTCVSQHTSGLIH